MAGKCTKCNFLVDAEGNGRGGFNICHLRTPQVEHNFIDYGEFKILSASQMLAITLMMPFPGNKLIKFMQRCNPKVIFMLFTVIITVPY